MTEKQAADICDKLKEVIVHAIKNGVPVVSVFKECRNGFRMAIATGDEAIRLKKYSKKIV